MHGGATDEMCFAVIIRIAVGGLFGARHVWHGAFNGEAREETADVGGCGDGLLVSLDGYGCVET